MFRLKMQIVQIVEWTLAKEKKLLQELEALETVCIDIRNLFDTRKYEKRHRHNEKEELKCFFSLYWNMQKLFDNRYIHSAIPKSFLPVSFFAFLVGELQFRSGDEHAIQRNLIIKFVQMVLLLFECFCFSSIASRFQSVMIKTKL